MSDLRLVPLAVVVWATALLVPGRPTELVLAAIVGLTLLGFAALFLPVPRRAPIVLVLLGATVTTAVSALHVAAARAGPVPALASDTAVATAELVVRTDPRPRPATGPHQSPYVLFDADLTRVRGRGRQARVHTAVVVTAPTSWAGVQPGELVRAVVRLAPTEPADRAVAFVSARSPPERLAPPGALDQLANKLRAGLRAAVGPLPPAARGLLPSLVVGDVSQLPEDVRTDLEAAGLTRLP